MNKKIGSYELDTSKLNQFFDQHTINTIFLQLPEGFQHLASEVQEWLTKEFDIDILLDANPCYGACDLPGPSILNQLGVDALIQIGHLPIPSMNLDGYGLPILFLNAQSTLPIDEVVNTSIASLQGTSIGIVTTAQHLHHIESIKQILTNHGLTSKIGSGDNRLFSPGQLLGCNFTAATTISKNVDSFLFIGSGFFHPLGLLLSTNKPVICADPYTNHVIDAHALEEKKQQVLRQRYGAIAFAQQARTIAIIIGLKPGQMRQKYAWSLQKKVLDSGKCCILMASDTITSSFVDRFPFVDVFVSTACPRIAIDDYTSYKKPILTPIELEVGLKQKSWDDYVFDEIFGD